MAEKEEIKQNTNTNYKINRSNKNNYNSNETNETSENTNTSINQNSNKQYNRQNNNRYENRNQNNYSNNGYENRNQNNGYENRNQNNGYDNRNQNNGYPNKQQNNGYENRQQNNGYENRQQNNGYNRNKNNGYDNRKNNNNNKQYNNQEQNTFEKNVTSTNTNSNSNTAATIKEELYDNPNTMTPENILKREECMIPLENFDDLSKLIDLKIIRGVMSYGFEEPSPIQQKAIKPLLSSFDLIAQAQSGTGKTATFCIGTLGRIDFTKNETQAVVLAHTLELAQQIEHVFTNIGKYTDLRLSTAVKTTTVRENIDILLGRNNPEGLLPHVVIGTPGRVLDMIKKSAINVDTLRVLICDEADELLSDGFILQIKEIIGSITEKTQIGLFSATMDTNFFKLTEKFLRNPINILIKKENLTLEGIKQFYIDCEKNDFKFETLCDLYSLFSTCQTIIYCNYHQSVEILAKKMQEQDFKVSYIHGGMNIAEREDAMKKFRNLTTRVLISTDLLGRGIDVQQVSIVINYDIPFKSEAYIHRIGRSGRHGRTGTAINFTTNNDIKRMNDIEKYYETRILPLPSDMASVFQANF